MKYSIVFCVSLIALSVLSYPLEQQGSDVDAPRPGPENPRPRPENPRPKPENPRPSPENPRPKPPQAHI